jgi:ATP-dependent DNA helicase RecQ
LIGSKDKRILENHHEELSTYGILSEFTRGNVRDWVEQLVGQGYLAKTGEYNVLTVTTAGWEIIKGNIKPRLLEPLKKKETRKTSKTKAEKTSWEGVDSGLFEELRDIRKNIADTKGVPAFVVFGDASLRDMARKRPSTGHKFLEIHGVGQKKRKDYGDTFVNAIARYCEEEALEMDV